MSGSVGRERLCWTADWHIREETYSKALAELVNRQHQLPMAELWGDGTTSSSDGQAFPIASRRPVVAQINAKYGRDPVVMFYTHVSGRYAPYHTKAINSTARDAPYVLDGLLGHEADLRIREHYTDTAGFTDQVFAACSLLGFRFAPRIRDLGDQRLYTIAKPKQYPTLRSLIGGTVRVRQVEQYWDEILRVASSIRLGTVTASLILNKLASYPRQNGLARALRELGRIERTLFMLDWIEDPDLRQRATIGLNKGEARNTLARAVFFYRRGAVRDRLREDLQNKARPQLDGCSHYSLEYRLPESSSSDAGRSRNADPRRMPAAPVAARLGAHQFHLVTTSGICGTRRRWTDCGPSERTNCRTWMA